jgi:hypothetical protein
MNTGIQADNAKEMQRRFLTTKNTKFTKEITRRPLLCGAQTIQWPIRVKNEPFRKSRAEKKLMRVLFFIPPILLILSKNHL